MRCSDAGGHVRPMPADRTTIGVSPMGPYPTQFGADRIRQPGDTGCLPGQHGRVTGGTHVALIELNSDVLRGAVVIKTAQIVSYFAAWNDAGKPDGTRVNLAAEAIGSSVYLIVGETPQQIEKLPELAGGTVHRWRP
jgi:hypothetical protein